MTLIHKFHRLEKNLNRRENVIVLIDEAHRSREGDLATYMRAAPEGLVALIPRELDPADETVRRFTERGIERLPAPEPAPEPMTPAELEDRIAA